MDEPKFVEGDISPTFSENMEAVADLIRRWRIMMGRIDGNRSGEIDPFAAANENAARSAEQMNKVIEDIGIFGTGFYWQGDDATITRIPPDKVTIGPDGYDFGSWRKPGPGKLNVLHGCPPMLVSGNVTPIEEDVRFGDAIADYIEAARTTRTNIILGIARDLAEENRARADSHPTGSEFARMKHNFAAAEIEKLIREIEAL